MRLRVYGGPACRKSRPIIEEQVRPDDWSRGASFASFPLPAAVVVVAAEAASEGSAGAALVVMGKGRRGLFALEPCV